MFTPRSKRFLIICLLNKRINYQMNHNQFIYSLSLILFLCNKINLFAPKEYFFKNPTAKRLRDHPSYSFHKASSLVTIFIPLYDRIFFYLLLDFNYRLHMISFTNIQISCGKRSLISGKIPEIIRFFLLLMCMDSTN